MIYSLRAGRRRRAKRGRELPRREPDQFARFDHVAMEMSDEQHFSRWLLETMVLKESSSPTLAFVPWGDVFEDFYGSVGVSFDNYCEEFTGSWHVGLIRALRRQGVATNVYYSSTRVDEFERRVHVPTGATIVLSPATALYRAIYKRMAHPHHSFGYGLGVEQLFGRSTGLRKRIDSVLYHVAPYLAAKLWRLARQIRRDGCSAILCQDYEHAGFDKCIALGMFSRLPVYATFQGGTEDWNSIGRRLRPHTIRRAAGFLVGPAAESQRVHARYGVERGRIHQVLNALDDSIWMPAERVAARERFGIPQNALVVVWHGRVETHIKGLDFLMDAWEAVCRDWKARPLHLALLGSGQGAQAMRQRIASLPDQNVTWLDRFVADRELIRSFLAAGDIYAFPSRIEGQPIGPVEAMAAGLPVVAADASGVREIFMAGEASGGVIVARGDIAAFSAAIRRLLDDAEFRRTLGANAHRRALDFRSETIGAALRRALFPNIYPTGP